VLWVSWRTVFRVASAGTRRRRPSPPRDGSPECQRSRFRHWTTSPHRRDCPRFFKGSLLRWQHSGLGASVFEVSKQPSNQEDHLFTSIRTRRKRGSSRATEWRVQGDEDALLARQVARSVTTPSRDDPLRHRHLRYRSVLGFPSMRRDLAPPSQGKRDGTVRDVSYSAYFGRGDPSVRPRT
jgi:hypothetical protein